MLRAWFELANSGGGVARSRAKVDYQEEIKIMEISLCNYKKMATLALTSVVLTFSNGAGAQPFSVNADEKYLSKY